MMIIPKKHKIDDFCVQFPSAWSRAPKIIQKLKEEDKNKNKYSPQIEDITDDEEEKRREVYRKKNKMRQVHFKLMHKRRTLKKR